MTRSGQPARHRTLDAPAAGRRRRLILAGGALTVALALVTVPAYGYFIGGGAGSGTARTGALQPLVVLAATSGSPSSALRPGGSADLLLNVSNTNGASVTVVRVQQAGGVIVTGGGAGCTSDPDWPALLGTSGVTVPTLSGLDIVVPTGPRAVLHLAGAASMSTSSASACQGATFQVPVTVVAHQ